MRDDDSILTAYIDDQLDSEARQRLESAMLADPQLAEELRKLVAVRDLVAGLPREASVNVAPQVMERVRSLASRRSHAWFRRLRANRSGSRPALVVGAMISAAAIVLFAITLALSMTLRTGPLVPGWNPAIADADSAKDSITAEVPSDAQAPSSVFSARSDSSDTILIAAAPTSPLRPATVLPQKASVAVAAVAPESRDLEQLRQLLDNPNLGRLFFVRNGKGGKAEQQVASVVERTTRYGFFKINVAPGIVIDPRHPGEATVYALVVNPDEVDQLRNQLMVALLAPVEDTPADASIVTQLADIGQVQSLQPVGKVSIPRAALAFRTPESGRPESTEPPLPPARRARRETESAKTQPEEKVVVLVWVYKPRAG
jgi:hypothetical protein